MYDVIIIGAGVSGCSIARELAKTKRKIAVLEASLDVCEGTSKANSGIAHAGFDAKPGSLKAKLNVRGSQLLPELAKQLDFPYEKNGSLILCFDEQDRDKLQDLYQKGMENGVQNLQIIDREQVLALEPQVSKEVVAALYAPTGGIVCPFGLTIAMAENAAVNGVEFYCNQQVIEIKRENQSYAIQTKSGETYQTKLVINAAGTHADEIHNLLPITKKHQKMHIIARKGEYCLYDKKAGSLVTKTIFQLPSAYGKGVLVTPTVHGNLLIGPTAVDIEEKDGVYTTQTGLAEVLEKSLRSVDALPSSRQIITSFAGIRAHVEADDFIIEESKEYRGFIDVAGIESPGLTSAPAIGEYVAEIVAKIQPADKNTEFIETRKGIPHMAELSLEERQKLISQNPAFANIICRCESISEGEILEAIHRPVGATTVDGVKRRTRAGMGRCQGGFCSPKVTKLLAQELQIPLEQVRKSGETSAMLYCENKMLSK